MAETIAIVSEQGLLRPLLQLVFPLVVVASWLAGDAQVQLKIEYRSDIRRAMLSDIVLRTSSMTSSRYLVAAIKVNRQRTLIRVKDHVAKLFGIDMEKVRLTYRDDSGDVISISCAEDLWVAVRLLEEGKLGAPSGPYLLHLVLVDLKQEDGLKRKL
ncbi:hypothetical protein T492DRAFT_1104460 [Pavlovales sp. CCMP2436]|nr:hypothetical protein T492DRAFT_1104460 [Pavlovales sp. CCMP2436]